MKDKTKTKLTFVEYSATGKRAVEHTWEEIEEWFGTALKGEQCKRMSSPAEHVSDILPDQFHAHLQQWMQTNPESPYWLCVSFCPSYSDGPSFYALVKDQKGQLLAYQDLIPLATAIAQAGALCSLDEYTCRRS